jgi:DNA replication protein DnaC
MSESSLLLESYLKTLKLQSFLDDYETLATQYGKEGLPYCAYLQQLCENEINRRYTRAVADRIKRAGFPSIKSLDNFEFAKVPEINKIMITELATCEYIEQKHNIISIGNSGMGKTHIAIALGVFACQRRLSVGYYNAAKLVHQLLEANEENQFLKLQQKLKDYDLLIIDELGYIPLSKTGSELLFDVFSSRYETGSVIVTTNLPFENWTEVFGCQRLTGALLDRLTHHVHILHMNGPESYRLSYSKKKNQQNQAIPAEELKSVNLAPVAKDFPKEPSLSNASDNKISRTC